MPIIKIMNKFTLEYAQQLDKQDPIAHMRDEFYIPKQDNGEDEIYLCGNSLGLQPKKTAEYLNYELSQWQKRFFGSNLSALLLHS